MHKEDQLLVLLIYFCYVSCAMKEISQETRKKLIQHLSNFVLDRRYELFLQVLSNRTRYITVVLEDIYQAQNASAVLRTCDCLGVQDIHIIENKNWFTVDSEVDMGASKWLTLHRYSIQSSATPDSPQNTLAAISRLKQLNYRVVATSPHVNGCLLDEFDVTRGKFALLFGTELTGLSDLALSSADEHIRIPMYGFTESYNISVSAALTVYELTKKIRQSNIDFHLTDQERDEVLLEWLRASIRNSKLIEKRFFNELIAG